MAEFTATCGAGAFKFEDPTGIEHTVTTGQTFGFTLTDGGASAVTYQQKHASSMTTTDGRTIVMRPQVTNSSGTNVGTIRTWGPTADAQDAVAVLSLAGEFVTEFTEGNIVQYWKAETLTIDNVDSPGTIAGRWRDQFGRYMNWVGITTGGD